MAKSSLHSKLRCGRTMFPVLVFLLFLSTPLYAQLNFNSGNFGTVGFGATTFALTPSGGIAPYTFSYAPGATIIPGFRLTNRPNVPNFFAASATGGLVGLPLTSGAFATTIRLTDGSGAFVDKAVNFTVAAVDIGGGPQFGFGVGDNAS